jgi:alpha-N-arabinofuranosidase
VSQLPNQIRRIPNAHREYRRTIPALAGRDIRIALDEWNCWYGPHIYGELGTRYFLKDALGIAAGIHEFSRQSDMVFMANYGQTVNVIGAIKTTKTAATFETTGLVLKMYRGHFGHIPAGPDTTPAELVPLQLLRILGPRPRVSQGHGSIEDQAVGRRVGIDREITESLELEVAERLRAFQARLQPARGQHL